jgi:hypothetical protein
MKFGNKKEFWYGTLAYASPFRALVFMENYRLLVPREYDSGEHEL